MPRGQVEVVSSPELLSLWRPPLFQGFVIQQVPAPQAPLVGIASVGRQVTTDWQNFAYAIQWWLFGAFAVFWFGGMLVAEEPEDRGEGWTR